ncbi:hypothetical protein VNO77_03434 [Canavalia gladiata]|uniref:Uncharacterized protein n=1 Tax=Canavalia gladiata TaxID=3824 RepID=A0AAN9MZP7_CANGL
MVRILVHITCKSRASIISSMGGSVELEYQFNLSPKHSTYAALICTLYHGSKGLPYLSVFLRHTRILPLLDNRPLKCTCSQLSSFTNELSVTTVFRFAKITNRRCDKGKATSVKISRVIEGNTKSQGKKNLVHDEHLVHDALGLVVRTLLDPPRPGFEPLMHHITILLQKSFSLSRAPHVPVAEPPSRAMRIAKLSCQACHANSQTEPIVAGLSQA